MQIRTDAPAVVRLDVTINAPLETVWQLHTDIDGWPSWHPDVTTATLHGPLAVGAVFDWETAGLAITSTVVELTPTRRIAWGGPAHGIDGIHVWTFETDGHQTVVHTEESWDGEPVRANPAELGAALEASLTSWLAALKATAERSARAHRGEAGLSG
jgi:uncharacterized protein YndB with AHSA1/START domain